MTELDSPPSARNCRCDGNPAGGSCRYPDCQMEPPTTEELLGESSPPDARELKVAGLLPHCGEWVGDNRCNAPAEFILWGKLFPAEGLGPRCYDHAAKHAGHRGLTRPGETGWAIADLRPLWRMVGAAR